MENVPIRMRVIYNHNRIEFTTGYRIDVAKWDEGKQRIKNGCTNKLKQTAAEINSDLLKYYADIQDIFKEFEVMILRISVTVQSGNRWDSLDGFFVGAKRRDTITTILLNYSSQN